MDRVEEINAVLTDIDWEDAFIQSVTFLSPTRVEPAGIVAAECLGDLDLVLGTTDSRYTKLCLRFKQVDEFSMRFSYDLYPCLVRNHGKVFLKLYSTEDTAVEADDVELIPKV